MVRSAAAAVLAALFCLFPQNAPAREFERPKRILVLYGESSSFAWYGKFNAHLHSAVAAAKDIKINVSFHFLGLEHIPDGSRPEEVVH